MNKDFGNGDNNAYKVSHIGKEATIYKIGKNIPLNLLCLVNIDEGAITPVIIEAMVVGENTLSLLLFLVLHKFLLSFSAADTMCDAELLLALGKDMSADVTVTNNSDDDVAGDVADKTAKV